MPLPTQASRSSPYAARRGFALALLALSLGATPALASRYVVDIDGSGDFTKIQAAINQQATQFRDTILVMPGEYDESPWFPFSASPLPTYVIGASGAAATSVQSIGVDSLEYWGCRTAFEGLTFGASVAVHSRSLRNLAFTSCVFRGPVHFSDPGNDDAPRLSDCDFYGRTRLESLLGYVRNLRFHGAPLYLTHSYSGSFYVEDCTFEGPADTLVYMPWSHNDVGAFARCSFFNAVNGIVYGEECWGSPFEIAHCAFRDLAGMGVLHDARDPSYGGGSPPRVDVTDSRFERCGTAVHWFVQYPGLEGARASFTRDTVLDCSGDGIYIGPSTFGSMRDCLIEGCGGSGAVLAKDQLPISMLNTANYDVVNSRFARNRGDGLTVRDTCTGALYVGDGSYLNGPRISACTFLGNGGAGLRLDASMWGVRDCESWGNEGAGFSLNTRSREYSHQFISNTSALNLGDGFRVTISEGGPDSFLVAQRNLGVMNSGAGFRMPAQVPGSFSYNDAWRNYLGQYVGAWDSADSNLTVDPRFCDLGAGDLGLQQGSPCGAGGVYGLIGARPESCPNTTAVEPPASQALAFAVRPSVARGSVEFVPPASGAEGVVELFDLAGRVVWRSPLGPASGVVRWHGDGEGGRVGAGLYWARLTRGAERATRRLVWLD
jgi:hypothetical protein